MEDAVLAMPHDECLSYFYGNLVELDDSIDFRKNSPFVYALLGKLLLKFICKNRIGEIIRF